MANPYIDRIFKKLGFFHVEETAGKVFVGHIPECMIEALIVDGSGNVLGGSYAEFFQKVRIALDLFDCSKDEIVFLPPHMRERFFEKISQTTGLPLSVVLSITK